MVRRVLQRIGSRHGSGALLWLTRQRHRRFDSLPGCVLRDRRAQTDVGSRQPLWRALALAESLDHVGPLTRSVADAGIMLQAIAGHDPNDPTSLTDPVPNVLADIDRGAGGIRIGFDEHYATHDIDPELAEAVVAAVELLEGLGAEVVEVKLPDMDPFVAAWMTLCSAEAVAAHRATYPSRRDDYGPWFRGWLDSGAAVTGAEYAEANNLRAASNGHLRRVLKTSTSWPVRQCRHRTLSRLNLCTVHCPQTATLSSSVSPLPSTTMVPRPCPSRVG